MLRSLVGSEMCIRDRLTALGKVSFDGVTGKVAFDEYGDTTSKVLTVYKLSLIHI